MNRINTDHPLFIKAIKYINSINTSYESTLNKFMRENHCVVYWDEETLSEYVEFKSEKELTLFLLKWS